MMYKQMNVLNRSIGENTRPPYKMYMHVAANWSQSSS